MTLDLWTARDADVAYRDGGAAPTVAARGGMQSRMMSPREFALWLVTARLDDGAEFEWSTAHGDEIVYVKSGELVVGDRVCPPDGSVLVEAGVPVVARARGATEIVHFGPWDPAPPTAGPLGAASTEGRSTLVIGAKGMYLKDEPGRLSKFYADSSQPASRLTLLYTAREDGYVSSSHSHSEDEIIYLLVGSIQVGRDTLGPGDCVGIAGDRRYGFRSSAGFGFLNYRRDASLMTINPKDTPFLEGGQPHAFEATMDFVTG